MSTAEILILAALAALATVLSRSLAFLLFPAGKEAPAFIRYLGRTLPAAVFGMLLVYCLKSVSVAAAPHGIPEAIALAAVVLLHLWKRQMLLSVAGGTVLYMILVQLVF